MSSNRRYELKVRADRQRETRRRIVEATATLHREVGPARTTIADIARRAGVERLTVYNHFPRVGQLLGACQAEFLQGSPPPDISPGDATRRNAAARLEFALTALYAWFRSNEAMEANVHRDRRLVPELDELLAQTSDPIFDGAARDFARLMAPSRAATAGVRGLVRVALHFGTWELLTRSGLSDRDAARQMARAVRAASSPQSSSP